MKVVAKEEKIQQSEKYRYLDSVLPTDWKSETEVKMQTAIAKETFNNKNLFFRSIELEMRK